MTSRAFEEATYVSEKGFYAHSIPALNFQICPLSTTPQILFY